jgi:hypothetical protein
MKTWFRVIAVLFAIAAIAEFAAWAHGAAPYDPPPRARWLYGFDCACTAILYAMAAGYIRLQERYEP